ncbi:lytic polysaccharide monooxygenase [Streptomyces achromogenes]|uniref:lytic polysaccharide monooxygenase n=1 Tax=Streptomyces achromogenes TaxID=67255 RepID=UPI0036C28BA6
MPGSRKAPASAVTGAALGLSVLTAWPAGGRHRELIPDGRLCSAGNEEFKGLDLARADWPATRVRGGSYTFKYRVTAPHKGTFTVYAVDFGGGSGGGAPVPGASAPSEEQLAAGADKSMVEHHGHGDDDARTSAEPAAAPVDRPAAEGGSVRLAETGASAGASRLAVGGAAALAVGSAALFLSVRRRAAGGGRRR